MLKTLLAFGTVWCLLLTPTSLHAQNLSGGDGSNKIGPEIGKQIAKENQISIDLFRKIQADKEALDSIVLLDVRSDSENSVSVIPGAITKAKYEAEPSKYAGKTVVCYCLSGGRSGKYVKQLKSQGVPAVDLKGSILEWCKYELPLTTPDGKPTNKVNVYDNKVPAKYEPAQ
jgi:rhodanese-related sulfurtransferase